MLTVVLDIKETHFFACPVKFITCYLPASSLRKCTVPDMHFCVLDMHVGVSQWY
jgi:hypothetical protein